MNRRILLATGGTLAGLAALVGAKSGGQPLTPAGGLPTAALAEPGRTLASSPAATSATAATVVPRHHHHHDDGPVPPAPTLAPVAPPTGTPLAGSRPGTYTGQAITTRYGVVQVRITVAAGRLSQASFVQLTAFDGHSQEINSFAGPVLLQETLSAQSAKVDTVSGATYTSDGYRQSLQKALDQARG